MASATSLKLLPGETVVVEGKIFPNCSSFQVDLGKDIYNLVFHISPRFNCCNTVRKIVCNSRREGVWGSEIRDEHFPFVQGGHFRISVTFDTSVIKATLQDGHEIFFPNRLGLSVVDYVASSGDCTIQVLKKV